MQILEKENAFLIYDGDCPFCSRYVKLVRIRESFGHLELIDARQHVDVVGQVNEVGFDLDEGMLLRINDRWYYGADCINVLSLMSSPIGFFNRANALIFRSPQLSRILYPMLRFGRNTVLRILGRKKINQNGLQY